MQVRAFFAGATAPLVGGSLECGINYAVYSHTLSLLSSRRSAGLPSSNVDPRLDHDHSSRSRGLEPGAGGLGIDSKEAALVDVFAASALAGVALSFVLAPVELVKCRLQARLL